MQTTERANAHVLLSGVSLPSCCRPRDEPDDNSPAACVLLTDVARFNSLTGLCYVAWKCTSESAVDGASEPRSRHSQWIPLHQVSLVAPAISSADISLGRGPHDARFEVDNPLVELWSSETMGRFTVAKQRIRRGERAFQATAFAVVAKQSLVLRRCHWCFEELRKKALQCGDCEFARYCSRDCLSADATLHDFQCSALRKLKHQGNAAGGEEAETIRLVLAVLSMEHFVGNRHVLDKLVNHRSSNTEEEANLRHTVRWIVDATGGVIDPKHVQRTLERVRCNAHPLNLDGVTCVGTGVFPEAAMALNHSCLPNVSPSFDPQTRTLAFHAISNIPRRHAVEYAYIDLLQSRKRRQELLAHGFGFNCACPRCITEASKERAGQSADEEGHDAEEEQVTEQLMRIMSTNDLHTRQRLVQLESEFEDVFKRSEEAEFALYTAKMQLARAYSDWRGVIEAAERLLAIWTHCGLPEFYHTVEALHLQLQFAAKRSGLTERAGRARERVKTIQRVCGYTHPETHEG